MAWVCGRIESKPAKLSGIPVIVGTRIPVSTIIAALADYVDTEKLRQHWPELTNEDIRAAIEFAANQLDSPNVIPIDPEKKFMYTPEETERSLAAAKRALDAICRTFANRN